MSYIVDFLSPLLFFLVGYAILKDFHTCLAENSSVENSIGDIMTIDQWNSEWYFTPLPTQHMSIIFFPAWIYDSNPFWQKKSTLRLHCLFSRAATSCIEAHSFLRSYVWEVDLLHLLTTSCLVQSTSCNRHSQHCKSSIPFYWMPSQTTILGHTVLC